MNERPVSDPIEVRRALRLLHGHGSVFEVRIPWCGRAGTVSGLFDDVDAATAAIVATTSRFHPSGIYVTANPVDPERLGRTPNRLAEHAQVATSDVQILRRHWLLIDADPVRSSGMSTTNCEHDAGIERVRRVRAWLVETIGVPADAIVLADSGNGGHLLIRVDLSNDAETTALVVRCLRAVAAGHSDGIVKIDTTVSNASRIWKVYGTVAAKGAATTERPYRVARLLSAQHPLAIASRANLDRLAAMAPCRASGAEMARGVVLRLAEGQRNTTLTRVAGALRRHGVEGAALAECLRVLNAVYGAPPLPDNEVAAIARSVSRYSPATPRGTVEVG